MYIIMINTGYWQIQSEKSTWKKSINLGKKLWTDVKAQNGSWVEWIPHLHVSTFYMTVYISSTQSLNPRIQIKTCPNSSSKWVYMQVFLIINKVCQLFVLWVVYRYSTVHFHQHYINIIRQTCIYMYLLLNLPRIVGKFHIITLCGQGHTAALSV